MMKQLLIILLLALWMACSENAPQQLPPAPVYIGGVMKNVKAEKVFLKKDLLFKIAAMDSADLDSTGRFAMRIDLSDTGYYLISAGDEYAKIFLVPGDSINIFADALDFDRSLRYGGVGAEVNNYLARKAVKRYEVQAETPALNSLEPAQFVSRNDSIRTSMEDDLQAVAGNLPGGNTKFIDLEKSEILYWWAMRLEEYPDYHKYFTKNDSVILPPDFYRFRERVSINDSSLIALKTYTRYIQTRLAAEADGVIANDTMLQKMNNGYSLAKFRMAKKLFTDQTVKNFILTSILEEQFMYSGVDDTKEIYEEYIQMCTNDEFKNKIKEIRSKWDRIAQGMPAPDFRYSNISGDTFSLMQFKGKYVYIDVWATWCAPCKVEIPHLEKLNEEYKKSNIVFVSVSVDESKDAWIKMVTEKKMKGIQLYADGGWKSIIAEDYYIKSIPRFILIGKDGNIINANADRPSGKIREFLNGLEGINI